MDVVRSNEAISFANESRHQLIRLEPHVCLLIDECYKQIISNWTKEKLGKKQNNSYRQINQKFVLK
jgi:hypothetical protein